MSLQRTTTLYNKLFAVSCFLAAIHPPPQGLLRNRLVRLGGGGFLAANIYKMSGHCDFCNVWHSGSCCHPGQAIVQDLKRQLDAIKANTPYCGACAEALFCGGVTHEHTCAIAAHAELHAAVVRAIPALATLTIQIRQRYYNEITIHLQDQIRSRRVIGVVGNEAHGRRRS